MQRLQAMLKLIEPHSMIDFFPALKVIETAEQGVRE
jgi:hypothetical protein